MNVKFFLELNENEQRIAVAQFEISNHRRFPHGLLEKTFERTNPVISMPFFNVIGDREEILEQIHRTKKQYDKMISDTLKAINPR